MPMHGRGEQHETEPAQSTGFYKVTLTGAHGVTINPACSDSFAPSAFRTVRPTTGRHTFLSRIAKRTDDQVLSAALTELLRKRPTRFSPPRRKTEMPLPVDTDSRFQLLRIEESPVLPNEPVYEDVVLETISRLISERQSSKSLLEAGLESTTTTLFTVPPGVSKTLADRWIARELGRHF